MDISKLTDNEIDQLIARIQSRRSILPISDYAKEACQDAVTSTIFADGNKDGVIDNPQGYATRQDLAVVLKRAGLFIKKKS